MNNKILAVILTVIVIILGYIALNISGRADVSLNNKMPNIISDEPNRETPGGGTREILMPPKDSSESEQTRFINDAEKMAKPVSEITLDSCYATPHVAKIAQGSTVTLENTSDYNATLIVPGKAPKKLDVPAKSTISIHSSSLKNDAGDLGIFGYNCAFSETENIVNYIYVVKPI